jgi:hypothetical protein
VFQVSKVVSQSEHSKLAVWRLGPSPRCGCKPLRIDRIGDEILTSPACAPEKQNRLITIQLGYLWVREKGTASARGWRAPEPSPFTRANERRIFLSQSSRSRWRLGWTSGVAGDADLFAVCSGNGLS